MQIEYDQEKNAKNIEKHGLSFDDVLLCDWSKAIIKKDKRRNYGEARYNAYLPFRGRLYNVVFTKRWSTMRVISFGKANLKEGRRYGQED